MVKLAYEEIIGDDFEKEARHIGKIQDIRAFEAAYGTPESGMSEAEQKTYNDKHRSFMIGRAMDRRKSKLEKRFGEIKSPLLYGNTLSDLKAAEEALGVPAKDISEEDVANYNRHYRTFMMDRKLDRYKEKLEKEYNRKFGKLKQQAK